MTPTAEQGFEEWWAVYGKQPPKMNEDHVDWVRDAYLTAYRAGLLAAAEIVKKDCVHGIGTCEDMAGCHEQIIVALREAAKE